MDCEGGPVGVELTPFSSALREVWGLNSSAKYPLTSATYNSFVRDSPTHPPLELLKEQMEFLERC